MHLVLSDKKHYKEIVSLSRDRELLQWILIDGSVEYKVVGAYFYSFAMPCSCFNSKKACFRGFLFDSHSVNSELQ